MTTTALNTLPTDVTLATLVYEAQDSDDAIVGRYEDQGGELVIFTDREARDAWVTHVGGFESVGSFVVVIPDPDNEEEELPVEVAYGRY